MPFHMSTIEVRGVPVRVFDSAPPNMRMLWESTAAHGDKTYICYEDEHYSYADIHAQVRKLAHHMAAQGVQPGDRVALAMRNYPEWVVGYWAAISLGAACVGMNAWWTPHEMEYALDDSHPRVLIVDGERLERVSHILEAVRVRLPKGTTSLRHPEKNMQVKDGWAVLSSAQLPAKSKVTFSFEPSVASQTHAEKDQQPGP